MTKHNKLTDQQEIDMIEAYYNGTSSVILIEKYGLTEKVFHSIKRKKHIVLTFDKKLFFTRLEKDYKQLTPSSFVEKYVIQHKRHKELKTKMGIQSSKMMRWLEILQVPYTSQVMVSHAGDRQNHIITYKGYYVEPTVKREKAYTMSKPELDDYTEKISILKSQHNVLEELLEEKNLSIELQHRIKNLVNTIARESFFIGIVSTKNGYGDKLEFELMKNMGVV